jgi:hypothetical protein
MLLHALIQSWTHWLISLIYFIETDELIITLVVLRLLIAREEHASDGCSKNKGGGCPWRCLWNRRYLRPGALVFDYGATDHESTTRTTWLRFRACSQPSAARRWQKTAHQKTFFTVALQITAASHDGLVTFSAHGGLGSGKRAPASTTTRRPWRCMDEALHVDSWHGGLAWRLRRLLFLVEARSSNEPSRRSAPNVDVDGHGHEPFRSGGRQKQRPGRPRLTSW